MVEDKDRVLRWRLAEIQRLKEENKMLEQKNARQKAHIIQLELTTIHNPTHHNHSNDPTVTFMPSCSTCSTLQSQAEQANLELDRAEAEVEILRKDNRALYAALEAKIESLPSSVSGMANKVALAKALGGAADEAREAGERADRAEGELEQLLGVVGEVEKNMGALATRNSELEAEVMELRERVALFDVQMEEAVVENDALLEYAHSRATQSMILADQVMAMEEEEAREQDLEERYNAALEINLALKAKVATLVSQMEESGLKSALEQAEAWKQQAAAAVAQAEEAKAKVAEQADAFHKAEMSAKTHAVLQTAYMDTRAELAQARSRIRELEVRVKRSELEVDLNHSLLEKSMSSS